MQDRSASYKAKVLCFCANDNDCVKVLDLSNCVINNKVTKIIAKTIEGNKSLHV